jgi:hypothetical protein
MTLMTGSMNTVLSIEEFFFQIDNVTRTILKDIGEDQ